MAGQPEHGAWARPSSGPPLAVGIDDFADGAHFDAYSAIVEQFRFGD